MSGRKNNNLVIGLIFIILGLLFLLKNLNIFGISFNLFDIGYLIANFWPAAFLILPGVLMHSAFFSGKNRDAGILVPGGILLVTGVICQLSTSFGMWGILWPGFILAVAVGLFELYMFGTRDKGLLVPVCILGCVSAFFFASSIRWLHVFSFRHLFVPVVLILLGVLVIYKNRPGRNDF